MMAELDLHDSWSAGLPVNQEIEDVWIFDRVDRRAQRWPSRAMSSAPALSRLLTSRAKQHHVQLPLMEPPPSFSTSIS